MKATEFTMRILLTAAMLAGSAYATPAVAQETSPFTGLRVEGIGGYDTLRSGADDDDGETSDNNGDESIDGVAYGVGVGFDFDLGGVVAGVEGEYTDSTGEQDNDETVDGVPVVFGIDVSRDLYIGGRLGFAVTPSTLLYAKGGYTSTRIESTLEDNSDSFNFDTSIDGYRIGAGVEQLFGGPLFGLGSSAFGKLEYRYSNYGNFSFDDEVFADEEDELDIDLDRHQVMAGIGIRF